MSVRVNHINNFFLISLSFLNGNQWNRLDFRYGFATLWKKKTSNAGLQYRRGRVGRGIQPPSRPLPHPHYQHSSNTLNFLFFTQLLPTVRRTDKASYRVTSPRLNIEKKEKKRKREKEKKRKREKEKKRKRERTRSSRPICATCGSSNKCVTDRSRTSICFFFREEN